MGGLIRDAGGTGPPRRPGLDRRAEAGLAMVDVVVASVVLLIILVPTAVLLSTSSRIVTNSKAQAVAQSLAATQVGADRALFTSTSSPPTYSTSCGSTTNTTYNVTLLSCPTVNGMKFWVFQNGGWCVTSSGSLSTIPAVTTAGTIPYYWVEVVVAWGGSKAPTTVTAADSVLLTSAIQTPSGYTGSTSAGCPL